MNNQLLSLSKIFTEKIFRIPDYQRGYAWGAKQLKDFWNDIDQLETDQDHYVGVLTLESVPNSKWNSWEDDLWIINSKSYEPYFVVDGQQRITTSLILIQAIIEKIGSKKKLNYSTALEIKKKFIYDSKDTGISRSYLFGYEKDNPSYDFLKRKIFLENGDGYRNEETIYTRNLLEAKEFFLNNLSKLNVKEIEVVFKKVTQHFLFNIYTISKDIDVFVTFETMNNRGKPLSNLELLKNRLIYLSTKFYSEDSEKNSLRKKINEAWKAVYHYLGKNSMRPLNDDFFLLNHVIVAFGSDIRKTHLKFSDKKYFGYKEIYDTYLLDDRFTLKNIRSEKPTLTIEGIRNYIESLQESVKVWYAVFNPTDTKEFSDEEKLYLDKLYRFPDFSYTSVLLAFYIKNPPKDKRIKFLQVVERYLFIEDLGYGSDDSISFTELTIKLFSEKKPDFDALINTIHTATDNMVKSRDYMISIFNVWKGRNFYKWRITKYFLYEYEMSLKDKSKTKREKINWVEYSKEQDEFVTIEHIYPQKATDSSWTKVFDLHHKRNEKLCNSLGNLLPLSKPKNSSLQNKPFLSKVSNEKDKVGYKYGSYSENEISHLASWTPDEILKRGLKLLGFMEERWQIQFGPIEKKIDLLGLSFMKDSRSNSA